MARQKKSSFTGSIAKRIDDTGCIVPLGYALDLPEFRKILDDRWDRLFKLRMQKMPELAQQLGMDLKKFDLTTDAGLVAYYATIALNLAVKFEIPGFLEVEPKWNPSIVMAALMESEKAKLRDEPNPDFNACLQTVKAIDPDLARPGRKTLAEKRARTLRNKVSALRQRLKREHHERETAEAKKQAAAAKVVIAQQFRGSDSVH